MSMLVFVLAACSLMIILGGLIGFRLAERSLDSKARRQAAFQRELNERAQALRKIERRVLHVAR